mgnify:FL=1
MVQKPSNETLAEMERLCEGRYQQLIQDGCDQDVAADRTFDAFRASLGEVPQCFDKRDRLFENKLRSVAERKAHA